MNSSTDSRLLPGASRLLGTLLVATTLTLFAPTAAMAGTVCGDGLAQFPEECDDGNVLDGDCCASDCSFEPVEGPCTDDNECTVDFCDGQGSCLSFPNQQAPCDDNNECTIGDFCNSDGFCDHDTTQQDGSTCADQGLCGGTGQCFNGFCSGDPVDCDGYGGLCNSAVCNPQLLQCEVTQLDDGTPCDNQSNCTEPGECSGGECIQPPTDCSHLADSCNDAFCDVEAQGCYSVPKQNGTPCDDGLCTEPGTCDDGECIDEPIDCSNFADQCNDADCNPETGCFASPKEDETFCDDGLFCNGADTCLDGACTNHEGDPCVGGGGCADDCNEDANSCIEAFGTVCRPSAGVCDTAETCDGTNPSCPGDSFLSTNTVCRSSAGSCDVEEQCPGFLPTCPADLFVTGGTLCRGSAGICDVAETCTGAAGACPANGFASAATTCRGSAGICDVAETCTGTTTTCPANDVATNGTPCRPSAGGCDVAETCNGVAATCPGNGVATFGTICRASAGICDIAETCDGTMTACPANAFVTSSATCRGSAGVCDVVETCTGSTAACPANTFASAATTCRGSAGICDMAETCTGATAACPADGFATGGTSCRESTGVCDVAEACDGTSANCAADGFVTEGSTCRESAGSCDVAEACTGATAACPADSFVPGESTCRESAGVCDVAETCNGTSASCPVDGFAASSAICRADAGDCDIADTCTGDSAACPADGFEASGTLCNSDENGCTDDTCDGAGTCQHTANTSPCDDGLFCTASDTCAAGTCQGSGNPCPGADSDGNCAESCDETANACTASDPDNSTCDDGVACTTSDTCQAGTCIAGQDNCGVCGNGVIESGETCDDGNTADGDCCASTCTSPTSGNSCDDGVFCNGADTCVSGACTQHAGDPCSGADGDGDCSETCDEEAGACTGADPDASPCDDGLFCTSGDTCTEGLCNGAPTCPPTDACEDTCDEVDDACRTCGHPFSNSRCVVNAVVVLQGALDLRACELCTCDVNADGQVTATDALMVLRTCVSLPTVLDCENPPPTTTTSTTSTTTTTSVTSTTGTLPECLAPDALDGRTYNEKYTCIQSFTGQPPFCADFNETSLILFEHNGSGQYVVNDVPPGDYVLTGTLGCRTFSWSASQAGEYNESGVWSFSGDGSSFDGGSAYTGVENDYAGVCNMTGEENPGVPPNPPTLTPCP